MPFSAVEAALAEFHQISSHKRTAFQARLKNFMRLGLFETVKAGRGKAAQFEAHDVFLLALALDLGHMGIGPERAVGIIGASASHIANAVSSTLSDSEGWSQAIMYFDPKGLQLSSAPDDRVVTLHFSDAEKFGADFENILAKEMRVSVISISAIIDKVAGSLLIEASEGVQSIGRRAFATALLDWAKSIGNS